MTLDPDTRPPSAGARVYFNALVIHDVMEYNRANPNVADGARVAPPGTGLPAGSTVLGR